MHIRKYDADYSRRFFLEQTAKGVATAGVLAPLWPLVAHSAEIGKAYPDELMSTPGRKARSRPATRSMRATSTW
jgi:hypothetical protein